MIDFVLNNALVIFFCVFGVPVLALIGHRLFHLWQRPRQLAQFASEAGMIVRTGPNQDLFDGLREFSLFQSTWGGASSVKIDSVLESMSEDAHVAIFDVRRRIERNSRDSSTRTETLMLITSPHLLALQLTIVPSESLAKRFQAYLGTGNRVAVVGSTSIYSELPDLHIPAELTAILTEHPQLFAEIKGHRMLVQFVQAAGRSFVLDNRAADDRVGVYGTEELHQFHRCGLTLLRALQRSTNLQHR